MGEGLFPREKEGKCSKGNEGITCLNLGLFIVTQPILIKAP